MILDRLKKYDDDIYAKATFAAAVFFVVFYVGYLLNTHPPRDAFGYMIGRDFVNDWMGARAVLGGEIHQLFDHNLYVHYLHTVLPGLPRHNWSYPPDILLFIWPLGFLPYIPAYFLWCAAGLGAYLYASCRGGCTKKDVFFLFVCPAVVVNLFAGQNGFFSAAFLIGGFTLLDRRPIVAGICFGLLTLKPQLGLLIPLALVLEGRWRTIFAAAATFAGLFAVSCAVFGFSAWSEYFRLAVPFQEQVMKYGTALMPMMMPTPFMNMRVMHFSYHVATWVQAPFTLFAIAAVAWTFAKRRDPLLSRAVLITAGFVVTPYVFNYDMVVFGWLVWTLRPRFTEARDAKLLLAVWSLPVTVMVVGLFGIPGTALVLTAFLVRLLWMLKCQEPARLPNAAQSNSLEADPLSPELMEPEGFNPESAIA